MMSLSSSPPSAPPEPHSARLALPLEQLVALLPDEGEHDIRWGARRQGERIPFAKPIGLCRLGDSEPLFGGPPESAEASKTFAGWALNVCHGGMRVITEEPLTVGERLKIDVSSSGTAYRGSARVCWVRSEADGVIAGLEFTTQR